MTNNQLNEDRELLTNFYKWPDRAKNLYDYTKEQVEGLLQAQSRIVRAEERERCIRIIKKYFNDSPVGVEEMASYFIESNNLVNKLLNSAPKRKSNN